ncbi:MAG: hypothetical protein ACD_48C00126G0001, partial [uncultured bacterium]
MFSFIIVQFAINILGGASGLNGSQGQQVPPGRETFVGVGSLGSVIKDHYPEPNQQGVYRNTKIVVTFTESIDPKTIINNDNNTCWALDGSGAVEIGENGDACKKENGAVIPYFGDCLGSGSTRLCDTLKTDVIAINRLSDRSGTLEGNPIVTTTAQASYDENDEVYTFVFKPQELLGNEEADQWHRVTITNDVLNMSGDSIFAGRSDDMYIWEFETNTEVDLTPPYVTDVSPNPEERVEKNRILKITFNEPVDPMMVQGTLSASSSFHNIIVDMRPTEEIVSGTSGEVALPYEFNQLSPYTGSSLAMTADDLYLYVADATSAKKIDLYDPTNVSTIFTTALPNKLSILKLYNGKLYLIVGTDIVILDPDTAEKIDVLPNVVQYPQDIEFVDGYAFIADGKEIRVVDIDPASGTFGTIIHTVLVATENGFISRIAMSNNTLYFIKQSAPALFGIVDLANPLQPTIIATTTIGLQPQDIAVYGDVVYITQEGSIKIADVSHPETGIVFGQFNLNKTEYGLNGYNARSLFIINDTLFAGESRALKAFSLANDPLQPSFLFSYPEQEGVLQSYSEYPSFTYGNETVFVKYPSQNIFAFNMKGRNGALSSSDRIRTSVDGTWTLTNGYKTVEFISNEACGVNSCGDTIYCLPTLCDPADQTCSVTYAVLARTASLDTPDGDSFVSAGLFDGVVDLADNAMDSAPEYVEPRKSVVPGAHDFLVSEGDGWRHNPPTVYEKTIAPAELASDNYWWFFTVDNRIDRESPYIEQVSPGIDQPGVDPLMPVDIHFSKEMSSSNGASLVEYPDSGVGLGYYQRSFDTEVAGVTKTTLSLFHPARPFGMRGKDYWYIPSVPGTVKAVNQFCMYPGRGPVSE